MFTIIIVLSCMSPDCTNLATAIKAQTDHNLTETSAMLHVVAAKAAATSNIPVELLLSMAYVESRYDARATSRIESGKRKTGVPAWSTPPASVSGPYFCGVVQSEAGYSWKHCLELRDLSTAYTTTAQELTKWIKVCHSRDPLPCALSGYGGGFAAIKAGTSTYSARVLLRAKHLRKALGALS